MVETVKGPALLQKQGRFEVYEGDAPPPLSPPIGAGAALMEQHAAVGKPDASR